MSTDYTIRTAQEGDIDAILSLLQELAEYEKLAHECKASKEALQLHLFGEMPAAEAIVAEDASGILGFALFFQNFSTFECKPGMYLEDLYVNKSMRGKGIGKELLRSLAEIAVERDYGRLEWSVLNWNEPAIKFYRSLNTQEMDEWCVHRLSGETLKAAAQK